MGRIPESGPLGKLGWDGMWTVYLLLLLLLPAGPSSNFSNFLPHWFCLRVGERKRGAKPVKLPRPARSWIQKVLEASS